ncbi:MAG: hypothetical protein HEQ32_07620 [Vampirovibrio sp.]
MVKKKASFWKKSFWFTLKQILRIAVLFWGYHNSHVLVEGLTFGTTTGLLCFCLMLSGVDLVLRPVVKVLCLPLDLFSFGLARKLFYGLLMSVLLFSTLFYFAERGNFNAQTVAQQIQLATAIWIFTLTVLTVTR